MKDFDRLRIRFKQFGGFKLAWEYVRLGLLWIIIKELFLCVLHRRSFKSIYPAIGRVVDPMLIKRYHQITEKYRIAGSLSEDDSKLSSWDLGKSNINENGKTYVWSCWLQGWDKAPDLAKACLNSIKRNLVNVEIVELDENNYTKWVTMPKYIIEKYKKGNIPSAMFSDMLRLQLLVEHGGVWIDSTVLNSIPHSPMDEDMDTCNYSRRGAYNPSWEEIVKADLFVFQYTEPGHTWSGNISNWFIASKKRNPFIMTLRDMLFAYWKNYDVALEYYICHLFFNEVAKVFPEQIKSMPYGWSVPSISLGAHLHADFNQEKWNRFTSHVHWHKMTYRLHEDVLKGVNNNYHYIISTFM